MEIPYFYDKIPDEFVIDKELFLFYDQVNLVYKIDENEFTGGFINEHDVEMVRRGQ